MGNKQDETAMNRFLDFVSKNNGPYGSMAYWVRFYLDGVDASGKKVQSRKGEGR